MIKYLLTCGAIMCLGFVAAAAVSQPVPEPESLLIGTCANMLVDTFPVMSEGRLCLALSFTDGSILTLCPQEA